PLAEELPTASEEGCHCQKKREATARKIALLSRNNHNRYIVYKDSLFYKRSPLVIVEDISQSDNLSISISPGESSHWQYKFLLPVEGVPTARRMEIPLPGVCTAMMKKLPVKDRWQLH
nr:hypothetical protein [Tanacetum cinerariifolium]